MQCPHGDLSTQLSPRVPSINKATWFGGEEGGTGRGYLHHRSTGSWPSLPLIWPRGWGFASRSQVITAAARAIKSACGDVNIMSGPSSLIPPSWERRCSAEWRSKSRAVPTSWAFLQSKHHYSLPGQICWTDTQYFTTQSKSRILQVILNLFNSLIPLSLAVQPGALIWNH